MGLYLSVTTFKYQSAALPSSPLSPLFFYLFLFKCSHRCLGGEGGGSKKLFWDSIIFPADVHNCFRAEGASQIDCGTCVCLRVLVPLPEKKVRWCRETVNESRHQAEIPYMCEAYLVHAQDGCIEGSGLSESQWMH